jgi:hypothetical protein
LHKSKFARSEIRRRFVFACLEAGRTAIIPADGRVCNAQPPRGFAIASLTIKSDSGQNNVDERKANHLDDKECQFDVADTDQNVACHGTKAASGRVFPAIGAG